MFDDLEVVVIVSALVMVAVLCGFGGIWNNWIWLGKDGYSLPYNLRPGLFRFWFSIVPRKILGFKTGMEYITL